jgi:hypothetical protein
MKHISKNLLIVFAVFLVIAALFTFTLDQNAPRSEMDITALVSEINQEWLTISW